MSKEKPLKISDLVDSDREALEAILDKDLNDLTVHDIAVMKARRGYLAAEQVDYFSDALNGKFKGRDFVEEETKEVAPVKEPKVVAKEDKKVTAQKGEKKEVRVISAKDYNQKTLVQMAKDAGLTVDENASAEELAALLTEHVNK